MFTRKDYSEDKCTFEEYHQQFITKDTIRGIEHFRNDVKESTDEHLNDIPLKQLEFRESRLDHCHTSGKIRGILCNSCNSVLGFSYENINILKNAIKFLLQNNKKHTPTPFIYS